MGKIGVSGGCIMGFLLLFTCNAYGQSAGLLKLSAPDTCTTKCKPGVKGMTPGRGLSFGVELTPNLSFRDEDGNLQVIDNSRRLHGRLRFPIVVKDYFKMVGGLRYSNQEFHFDKDYPNNVLPAKLDDRSLKSSGATLYVVKSLNHKYYIGGRAMVSFNGDFNGIVSTAGENSDISLALMLGLKKNENLEMGFGVAQGLWNNRYTIVPLFLYNYTKDKFGIEALLPAEAFARYNFSDKTALYAGLEYFGQDFMLNANALSASNTPVIFDHSALRVQTNIEQNLFSWVWINVKGGYQTSFGFDILSGDTDPVIANDLDGTFYGAVELSIRVPSNFRNKKKK